jgi:hypothetical protein
MRLILTRCVLNYTTHIAKIIRSSSVSTASLWLLEKCVTFMRSVLEIRDILDIFSKFDRQVQFLCGRVTVLLATAMRC